MKRSETKEPFCGWCRETNHAKCHAPCACGDADHSPAIEVARRMAAASDGELAPAFLAGRLDHLLGAWQ